MEHKYLSDGRKVVLCDQVNSTEWIVREIFVTDEGEEIASGKQFIADNLHDRPVKTYKQSEAERHDKKIREHKKEIARLVNEIRDLKNKRAATSDVTRWLSEINSTLNSSHFETLIKLLEGKIKWVVQVSPYYCEWQLPVSLEDALASIDTFGSRSRYQGLKLLSLFGRSGTNLQYRVNMYSDGSGSYSTIELFETYDQAVMFLLDDLEQRIDKMPLNDVYRLIDSVLWPFVNEQMKEKVNARLVRERVALYRELDADVDERSRKVTAAVAKINKAQENIA